MANRDPQGLNTRAPASACERVALCDANAPADLQMSIAGINLAAAGQLPHSRESKRTLSAR